MTPAGRPTYGRDVEAGEVGDPRELRLAQPDVEVEPVRAADLLAQERPQRAAVDPADHLADQVAVEQRRLAAAVTRLPQRRLRGDQRAHPVPVEQRLRRRRLLQQRVPGLVAEHLAQRRRRDHLRPVRRQRRVEVEHARGRPAPARTRPRTAWSPSRASPGCPRPTAGCRAASAWPAPQVDDPLPAVVHRHARRRSPPAASCSSSTASNASRDRREVGGRGALGVHAPMVALAWPGGPDRPVHRRQPGRCAAVPRDGPAGRGRATAAQPRRPAQPGGRPAVHPGARSRCARRPSGRSTSRCSATPSRSGIPELREAIAGHHRPDARPRRVPRRRRGHDRVLGRVPARVPGGLRGGRPGGDRAAGLRLLPQRAHRARLRGRRAAGRTGVPVPADRRDARVPRRAGAGAGGRQPREPHRDDAGARRARRARVLVRGSGACS